MLDRRALLAGVAAAAIASAGPAAAMSPGQRRLSLGGGGRRGVLAQAMSIASGAVSFRRVRADYVGPLFRLQRTSPAATLDAMSIAEADAFAAAGTGITFLGFYDQVSGTLMPVSGNTASYSKTTSAVASAVFNNDATVINLLTAQIAALQNCTGCTVHGLWTGLPNTVSSNKPLFQISTPTAASIRYAIRLAQTTGTIDVGGRRTDGDTAALSDLGDYFFGEELLGITANHNDGSLTGWRNGVKSWVNPAFQTTGRADNTTAASAVIDTVSGSGVSEVIWWNTPLTEAQSLAVCNSQQAYLQGAWTINDGAWSWWSDPIAMSNGSGITAVGMTSANGSQFVVEYDEATLLPLDAFGLTNNIYTQDDHNTQTPLYLSGGGELLILSTGHHNPRTGGLTDNKFRIWKSASGRIADLIGPTILTTGFVASNYLQGFQNGNDVFMLSNDDDDRSWGTIRSRDRGDTWTENRRLVAQATAPGGGQNQLYVKACQPSAALLRMAANPHPSNLRNALYLGEMNLTTGNLTSGATDFGTAYTGSGALSAITNWAAIYTPGLGRSLRLLDFADDGTAIAICEFDNADNANATYYLLTLTGADRYDPASWSKKTVVAAGAPFYNVAGGYWGGIGFARDAHTGLKLWASRQATPGGTSTWYEDRMTSADGGDTWATVNLVTSISRYIRPTAPRNASAALPVLFLRVSGAYGNFNTWTMRPIPSTG